MTQTKVIFMLNGDKFNKFFISERVAIADVNVAVERSRELEKEQDVSVRSFYFVESVGESTKLTPHYFLGGRVEFIKDMEATFLSEEDKAVLNMYVQSGNDRIFRTKNSDLAFLMRPEDVVIEAVA